MVVTNPRAPRIVICKLLFIVSLTLMKFSIQLRRVLFTSVNKISIPASTALIQSHIVPVCLITNAVKRKYHKSFLAYTHQAVNLIINISIFVPKSNDVILSFKLDLDYVGDHLNLNTNFTLFH